MADQVRRAAAFLTVLSVSLLLAPPGMAAAAKGKRPRYLSNPAEQTPLHLGRTTTSAASHSSSSAFQIGRAVFGLIIVIVLIFAVKWVLQKVNPKSLKGFRQTEAIELRASKALPNGSSLHVIQIGDRAILIGTSANGVSKLSDLTDEDMAYLEAADAVTRRNKKRGSFSGALAGALSAPSRLDEARRIPSSSSGQPVVDRRNDERRNVLDWLRDRTAR
jgi:flagellar biogenesis protein FliO